MCPLRLQHRGNCEPEFIPICQVFLKDQCEFVLSTSRENHEEARQTLLQLPGLS